MKNVPKAATVENTQVNKCLQRYTLTLVPESIWGSSPPLRKLELNISQEVLRVVDEVLSLNGRSVAFTRDTPLLGAIPELDSMAVVTLITTIEERFDVVVDDDDIDGSTFATMGSLTDFITGKLAA